jgi:hypothetical protein
LLGSLMALWTSCAVFAASIVSTAAGTVSKEAARR